VASGYNGGLWTGTGISSNAAASTPHKSIGYADASDDPYVSIPTGNLVVEYAATGDTNLDTHVDDTDVTDEVNHNGQTGADWADADVNYDGVTNLTDLLTILNNLGDPVPLLPLPTVPEPTSLGLLVIGATMLVRRNRQSV
jgi:hypothetical protein